MWIIFDDQKNGVPGLQVFSIIAQCAQSAVP